jgi:hypothetical protein
VTDAERSFQQLDPLGTLIGRPMTFLAAAGIPGFATVMTWLNRFDIDYPILAVAALAAIVVAGAALVYGSSPLRAPFSLRTHVLVIGAATLGYVLSALSMWQSNAYIRDDWGTIALGLTLLSLSQYRPPREIASTGLLLALFAGVFALLQMHSLVTRTPPIAFALVAMTPILALSLASATFARFLIEGLERWRRRARRAVDSFATENTDWIARSVQQDRVTILNQKVVPFFADVLRKGSIDSEERARAREISDAIRAVMVAEVDRTWLDAIVDQVTGHSSDDPDHLAVAMSTDQRTAVRALIVAIAGHPGYRLGSLAVSIRLTGKTHRATIRASLDTPDNVVRGEIAPYFAVMRIVFDELKVEFARSTLTLRFSYEQR